MLEVCFKIVFDPAPVSTILFRSPHFMISKHKVSTSTRVIYHCLRFLLHGVLSKSRHVKKYTRPKPIRIEIRKQTYEKFSFLDSDWLRTCLVLYD